MTSPCWLTTECTKPLQGAYRIQQVISNRIHLKTSDGWPSCRPKPQLTRNCASTCRRRWGL